ncbi:MULTISPECIES: outer membrane protein assembly factor BamB family protein [Natrialbaceae]|uniref:outer membrane protein assembly factor BamB family protein n=1 Tax=Natrialbaceae TaxID=1644061 RepID=UPI00207D04B1|nr:PQQ-binding-like beta-propeller repeat protein [Natronococcus sp. CG52]
MSDWNRRSVLATGAALSISGFASIGAGSEGDDAAGLPDSDVDPNPGMVDEDWPSFAGDAGHARFIEDGHEFDGDELEVAWTVDGDSVSHGAASSLAVAVADGTVYATGPVGAYDAADGSLRWENDDLDVHKPSVVGDTVYVTGEELYALDVSDGSVRWQTEFAPEEPIESQTVAYGAAFVVADGTLYALEADDGSVRWEIDSVTVETGADEDEEEFDFHATTAAANGVVYATVGENWSGAGLALEPETGDEIWRTDRLERGSYQVRATETAVLLDRLSYARPITDAQTGEGIGKVPSEGVDAVIGNELYAGGGDFTFSVGRFDGSETGVEAQLRYNNVSSVISGDTVYAYFYEPSHPDIEYDEDLVAFDTDEGTAKWVLDGSELPVGPICAISDETIYVAHDDELVALREPTDEDEGEEQPDEGDEDDESDDEHGDGDEPEDGGGQQEGEDEEDDQQEDESDGDEDEYEGDEDDCPSDCPDDDPAGGDGSGDDDDESEVGDDDSDSDSEIGDDGAGDETDDESGDAGDGNETDDTDADDEMPGFTTGAGLAGGAATLEWLRRRADADDEPAE